MSDPFPKCETNSDHPVSLNLKETCLGAQPAHVSGDERELALRSQKCQHRVLLPVYSVTLISILFYDGQGYAAGTGSDGGKRWRQGLNVERSIS